MLGISEGEAANTDCSGPHGERKGVGSKTFRIDLLASWTICNTQRNAKRELRTKLRVPLCVCAALRVWMWAEGRPLPPSRDVTKRSEAHASVPGAFRTLKGLQEAFYPSVRAHAAECIGLDASGPRLVSAGRSWNKQKRSSSYVLIPAGATKRFAPQHPQP